jgi:hypothetical protein
VQTGFGGYATCGQMSDGSILVSIGIPTLSAGVPTGQIRPLWSGLYDPAHGAWTRLTSFVWSLDSTHVDDPSNLYPGWILTRTPGRLYAMGDRYVTTLEDLPAGQSVVQSVGLYDLYPASVGGGTPYIRIPAAWTTRMLPTVGTSTNMRKFGAAKRFFVDYAFAGTSIIPTAAWAVTPLSTTASGTASTTPVLTAGLGTTNTSSVSGTSVIPNPRIQRAQQDFPTEMQDLAFQVTWPEGSTRAAPATGVVADIYGLGTEYQPTRDLR